MVRVFVLMSFVYNALLHLHKHGSERFSGFSISPCHILQSSLLQEYSFSASKKYCLLNIMVHQKHVQIYKLYIIYIDEPFDYPPLHKGFGYVVI